MLVKLLLLFMKVIKETASRQKLGYHGILIIIDAHSHVKHYARMVKAINNLHFLNKMTNVPIPKPLLFQVLFDCYLLSQPASQEHLPIASLSDGLDDFNLVFRNEECQLDASVL